MGDAGYFKDPITAHGITDALRDAELLADAVAEGGDAALAGYEARRDELAHGIFSISDRVASFEWTLAELEACTCAPERRDEARGRGARGAPRPAGPCALRLRPARRASAPGEQPEGAAREAARGAAEARAIELERLPQRLDQEGGAREARARVLGERSGHHVVDRGPQRRLEVAHG